MKGTTKSGFEYEIDERILGDWRVIKQLAKMNKFKDVKEGEEDGQIVLEFIEVMSEVEELIFADKGEALEKFILENHDGYTSPVILFKDIMSIFDGAKELKNS